MRKFQILIAFILCGLVACNEGENAPSPQAEITTISNLEAQDDVGARDTITGQLIITEYVSPTFFSLVEGEAVPVTDSNSTNWDIGFKGTKIYVNSGTSGPGNAAAYVATGTFDQVTEVPAANEFRQDNGAEFAIPSGSGNGWYNYDFMTNVISPIPGKILVIRTANGNYAKVEILSYYRDAPSQPDATSEARFYTFRYLYQPDGSSDLQILQ